MAIALGIWGRVSLPSYVSRWNRKRGPPEPGKPVTLVLTDVEGSTELWEWQHEVTGPLWTIDELRHVSGTSILLLSVPRSKILGS